MHHTIKPEDHGPLGKTMAEAVQACVHCGFCLPACPTYAELGQEMDSPRGRIVLMKEVLEGKLKVSDVQEHIDQCLGCLSCEPACPSGVPYRNLITPFKALSRKDQQHSFTHKLSRKLAEETLPYPKRFRFAAHSGKLAKPLAPFLPKSLGAMLSLLPESIPPQQLLPAVIKAKGTRRARVALLAGCAQQVLNPDINAATIDVLTRNGVEVVVPKEQGCCGALSWHVGNLDKARQFAEHNLKAFPQDVDAIITNAAGCGSGLHEYDLILSGTPFEKEAAAFKARVCDVTVFLDRLGDLKPIPDPGKKLRIAYHDACHLANAQGVRIQPRKLLGLIPGVEVLDIPDANKCCGSAGTYNIDQPDIAASLGKQKAERVLALKPDITASGNIGCITQLNNHLSHKSQLTVRHTLQIIRDAYASRL